MKARYKNGFYFAADFARFYIKDLRDRNCKLFAVLLAPAAYAVGLGVSFFSENCLFGEYVLFE